MPMHQNDYNICIPTVRLTAVCLLVMLSGCGGKTTTPSEAIDSGSALEAINNDPANLLGTWTTGCVMSEEALPSRGYTIINTTFSNDYLVSTRYKYEDASCTIPNGVSEKTMATEFSDATVSTDSGNANTLNTEIGSPANYTINAEPLSDEVTIWGLTKHGFFDKKYGIYLITDEGKLFSTYLEIELSRTTLDPKYESMRPATFNPSIFLVRM